MQLRIFGAMLSLLLLVPMARAKKESKPACDEGWTAIQKGVCYRISNTEVVDEMTIVRGEVKSPRATEGISLDVSLYKGGKFMCKGMYGIQNVAKGEVATFEAGCMCAVQNPDKIVVRADLL